MTLKKRRRLLRREPTNFTARAGMGGYRIKKRGESDNERKEMRSGTMQREFNEIRKASPMMEAQKKESTSLKKAKPNSPPRPNNKDDVARTTNKPGTQGTQGGRTVSLVGKQSRLDVNKDGKITGADFAKLRKSGLLNRRKKGKQTPLSKEAFDKLSFNQKIDYLNQTKSEKNIARAKEMKEKMQKMQARLKARRDLKKRKSTQTTGAKTRKQRRENR